LNYGISGNRLSSELRFATPAAAYEIFANGFGAEPTGFRDGSGMEWM
jgi:hypothetical protein